MKKIIIFTIIIFTAFTLFFTNGCKTNEENSDTFTVPSTSGYSKLMKTLDPDDTGVTSLTLFFVLRNSSLVNGTITDWSFKIKHDIVTLVEINNTNYKNYNLMLTGSMNVPSETANEIYIGTPPPFIENSLSKDILSFEPYIPNRIIVEVTVLDDSGEEHKITAEGSYTYETGVINESKYNIVGKWTLNRTVNGQKQEKQKMIFTGTKTNGSYTIYETDGKVFENGSYSVSNYKTLYFKSSDGTQYWGEFSDENNMNGTLNIPADKDNDPKTGTFTAKKL
jgi:hypothetical protein